MCKAAENVSSRQSTQPVTRSCRQLWSETKISFCSKELVRECGCGPAESAEWLRASADRLSFDLLRGRLLELRSRPNSDSTVPWPALQQQSPLLPARTKDQVHVEGGTDECRRQEIFNVQSLVESGAWKVLESSRQAGKGCVWL